MNSILLKYPPTLDDFIEIRREIEALAPKEFAAVLNSREYQQWLNVNRVHIRLLARAEATGNLTRRARRDAMLLESVEPMLKEIVPCT